MTNHEFDAVLGLARLALATGRRDLLHAARDAAWHLADVDFDPETGLVFRHGRGHRTAKPEAGHVWLRGVCLVGALTADRDLLGLGRTIAHALGATFDPRPDHPRHARDLGWPLLELEFAARFFGDERIAADAGRFAGKLLDRYDERAGVFRFAEGRRAHGMYYERAWITGGILVPALEAYVARTGDRRARRVLRDVASELAKQARRGGSRLPIAWWVRPDGRVTDPTLLQGVPECWMLLEGLPVGARRRLLARGSVWRALGEMPRPEHPDRATDFAIAARCRWVYE